MESKVGLEFAARTDPGLVRAQNEDAVAISPAHGFAVLADGMGGYNAGEVASSIATNVVKTSLEGELEKVDGKSSEGRLNHLINDSIQKANSAILDAASNEPQYSGMGTTIVAVLFKHDRVIIAHVGDSRAYRFRSGSLEQLTRDHSLLQEQIDAGLIDPKVARYAQNKNLVTRAVGVGATMEVEIHEWQAQSGDIYLLCSDGLSDMLQPEEICEILTRRQISLETACDDLVQKANGNGGLDNISVILIKVQSSSASSNGLLGRLLNWVN
jgi:protein phosphatase